MTYGNYKPLYLSLFSSSSSSSSSSSFLRLRNWAPESLDLFMFMTFLLDVNPRLNFSTTWRWPMSSSARSHQAYYCKIFHKSNKCMVGGATSGCKVFLSKMCFYFVQFIQEYVELCWKKTRPGGASSRSATLSHCLGGLYQKPALMSSPSCISCT